MIFFFIHWLLTRIQRLSFRSNKLLYHVQIKILFYPLLLFLIIFMQLDPYLTVSVKIKHIGVGQLFQKDCITRQRSYKSTVVLGRGKSQTHFNCKMDPTASIKGALILIPMLIKKIIFFTPKRRKRKKKIKWHCPCKEWKTKQETMTTEL